MAFSRLDHHGGGRPVRSLESWVFQMKMCLLIAAIAVTLGYQLPLRKDGAYGNAGALGERERLFFGRVPAHLGRQSFSRALDRLCGN